MANEWITFLQLIGEDKKWIGKVISINPTSKRIEILPVGGGTSIEVDANGGSFDINSYVYVQGRLITGQAPTISSATKEIVN